MPLPLIIGGAALGGAALVTLLRAKAGIAVKNETPFPLLIVLSQITPLHVRRPLCDAHSARGLTLSSPPPTRAVGPR